ncbi:unnamed protein product [Symbiodinium sp. CCMP2456]|nr:unnamed protein product [Symbiodinium sp. CCMP2456]
MVPVIIGLAAVSGCFFLAGCFFSAKIAAGFLAPQTLVDPLMYLEEASSAGARLPPSRCSLCLCPPCAISGYETGDLLLGTCRREALFSWIPILGSLYALYAWRPRDENIQGLGSQRTVRWPLATSSLVGSACTISFWESGDMITGLCSGDARRALCCMFFLCPMAWPCHARWAWAPRVKNFRRTSGTMQDDLVSGNFLVFQDQHVGANASFQQPELYARDLGVCETLEDCVAAMTCEVDVAVWNPDTKSLRALAVPRKAMFSVPYHTAVGLTTLQQNWIPLHARHLDLSYGPRVHYLGGIGTAWTTPECLELLLKHPKANYAVWLRDQDHVLHIFDITPKVNVQALRYYKQPGVLSFRHRFGAGSHLAAESGTGPRLADAEQEVFTYFEDTNACWLHGSSAVARPMSNAFSAERWCDLSKVSKNSQDFRSILTLAQKAALKAEKEGLGLAEQLFAATAATKTAMEGDLKGAEPEIVPLVSGQVAAEYTSRLGKGIRDAVMEAATATLHAAEDMGLDAKEQKNLAAKAAAIAASSGTQDLHLPVEKCAQQAAWAAQQAVAKLGFDVDRQAVAAVSAASSFMVSALRRKGKAPVEQAVEAAASAKEAAAGAAQNITRQIRIAIDVATAVAADGMRQLGRSSDQQAEAAADAVRQVAEIVGLSPAEQQLEAEKAAAQVKSLIGNTGKRAEVAVHPWQALGSSPTREPSLLPNQAQILGAGPATEKSFMPECAQAGIAYDDIDHPTLNGGVVDNAEHCQVSCSLNWFCESFTFFLNTKQCWLLGIKGTPRPDLDAISGPQVCGTRMEAAAKAITKSALDAAEKSFASGGGVDPKIALNRAATAARDTASSSELPEDRRWEEVAHAVGAAAAWIDEHNGASVDKQVSAAAKAAKSVAESHGMTLEMQLQLAVEAASAAAALSAGDDEEARTEAVIKAAKDTAAAMGVSAEEQTDLAVEAAARIAGLAAKEAGKIRKEQLEAVAAAADAAAQSLGLPTPRAKEVAATATSSAYIASKDISALDPIQLAIKTLGFDPETVPKCSIVNTAFNDETHPVNGGYVASANQCQETCQTLWYCETFTYNVTSKACFLLGDSATASPSQHVVSGPVKCGQRLLLKFVSIHDAMRSMSNSALQAAQEARLAGKGLTEQLHAAKTTVESFTAEADFARSDQVQMASVAVAECAARVAREAGLDTERQLHAASHAARKAARQAGMTDQEQWQQVTTAAAATALFLADTPMTRDQRSREARLAAQKVSLVSPFAPEVQVAQSAKAVQIAMAFTGSQTSDLPVLASQAARLSAAAIHLPEASQTALADQAKQQALDIQKHFEAMVDSSVTVKKDVLPGLGGIAKAQGDVSLGSMPSRFDVHIAEKVQDASEFGELHDVISHAIDGTTAAHLSAATAAKVDIAAKDEPLGSQSGMLRETGGPSTEQKRSFMWCTALVVVGVLVFAGVVFMVMEAGKGKKRSRKRLRKTRSGTPTPMAGFEGSDSDLLLYADEAPHPGEPAGGPRELSAPPQRASQAAVPLPVWGSQDWALVQIRYHS